MANIHIFVYTYNAILNNLGNVEYHMSAAREGRAPFHMDYDELLRALRDNLIENRELYKTKPYIDVEFSSMLNEHKEYLRQEFNNKIL